MKCVTDGRSISTAPFNPLITTNALLIEHPRFYGKYWQIQMWSKDSYQFNDLHSTKKQYKVKENKNDEGKNTCKLQ